MQREIESVRRCLNFVLSKAERRAQPSFEVLLSFSPASASPSPLGGRPPKANWRCSDTRMLSGQPVPPGTLAKIAQLN